MPWTLGALIDQGYTVTAHCEGTACNYSTTLPLEALAARHGRDASVRAPAEIGRRHLSCSHCGGRQTSIRIAPPYTAVGYR